MILFYFLHSSNSSLEDDNVSHVSQEGDAAIGVPVPARAKSLVQPRVDPSRNGKVDDTVSARQRSEFQGQGFATVRAGKGRSGRVLSAQLLLQLRTSRLEGTFFLLPASLVFKLSLPPLHFSSTLCTNRMHLRTAREAQLEAEPCLVPRVLILRQALSVSHGDHVDVHHAGCGLERGGLNAPKVSLVARACLWIVPVLKVCSHKRDKLLSTLARRALEEDVVDNVKGLLGLGSEPATQDVKDLHRKERGRGEAGECHAGRRETRTWRGWSLAAAGSREDAPAQTPLP